MYMIGSRASIGILTGIYCLSKTQTSRSSSARSRTAGTSSCSRGARGAWRSSRTARSCRRSSRSKFSDKRPCTNVPIKCPLDCKEIHWKYNLLQHLEKRHPSWRELISPPPEIQISAAEQRALGIPDTDIRAPSLSPTSTPNAPGVVATRGQKRPAGALDDSTPDHNKENAPPAAATAPPESPSRKRQDTGICKFSHDSKSLKYYH
ncbi:hypothetical protein B0H10DRAFT_214469 [Mycena sp. CBHHK59/15]|nr:hypothetical protein B0H10DRAFT_214469 [Mycena sp. CBHHK59/15]